MQVKRGCYPAFTDLRLIHIPRFIISSLVCNVKTWEQSELWTFSHWYFLLAYMCWSPGQSSQHSSCSLQQYIYHSNNFHSIDHSKLEIAELSFTWILAKSGGYQRKQTAAKDTSGLWIVLLIRKGWQQLHKMIKYVYRGMYSCKIYFTRVNNFFRTKGAPQIHYLLWPSV